MMEMVVLSKKNVYAVQYYARTQYFKYFQNVLFFKAAS